MFGYVEINQEGRRNDHSAIYLLVLVTKNEKVDTGFKWPGLSLLVCVALLYRIMCMVEVTRKKAEAHLWVMNK